MSLVGLEKEYEVVVITVIEKLLKKSGFKVQNYT